MSIYLAGECRIFEDHVVLGSVLAVVDRRLADLALVSVDIHLECLKHLASVHLVVDSQLAYRKRTVSGVEVDDHSHIVAVEGVPLTTRASSRSLCEP